MKVIVTAKGEYEPVAKIQEMSFYRTISKYPVLRIVKFLLNSYLSCCNGGGIGGSSDIKMYSSLLWLLTQKNTQMKVQSNYGCFCLSKNKLWSRIKLLE